MGKNVLISFDFVVLHENHQYRGFSGKMPPLGLSLLRTTNLSPSRLKQLGICCQLTKTCRPSWLQVLLVQGLGSHCKGSLSLLWSTSILLAPTQAILPHGSQVVLRKPALYPLSAKPSLSKLLQSLIPSRQEHIMTCDWTGRWSEFSKRKWIH